MSAAPLPCPTLHAVREAEWRPGAAGAAAHGEVFASSAETSGAAVALAFALACVPDASASPSLSLSPSASASIGASDDQRPWLWIQDREALRRGGRPYRPGLPRGLRHRLIHVATRTCQDALFALEEGLRCRDLAFVIGEITGNPRALSMTASRRLSLAVERHGVPLWLVRLDATRDLSSARQRWQVRAAPSPPPLWNPQAPGAPSWHAELFRARAHPPGEWLMRDSSVASGDTGLVAERASAPAEKAFFSARSA